MSKRQIPRDIIEVDRARYAELYQEFLDGTDYSPSNPFIVLNPYLAAPLSLYIGFHTSESVNRITITVKGKISPQADVVHSFDTEGQSFFFPVYGLYPDYANVIEIAIDSEIGSETYNVNVQTDPVPEGLSMTEIVVPAQRERLNDLLYYTSVLNSIMIAVDHYGDVRWMIYETYPDLPQNFDGDSAIFILNNGRLLGKDITHYALLEFDQTGRIYKIIEPGFWLHHDVIQLPNGNLVMQGDDPDDPVYTQDIMVTIDYETEEVVDRVDFKDILDAERHVQPPSSAADGRFDWLHPNGLAYHEETNAIINSNRHQNLIFAMDRNSHELKWLLGPHDHWSEEFQPYLLTPVDANGNPLYDMENEEDRIRADYEFWNWAQHCPKIYAISEEPNTLELFFFNNGTFRSYHEEQWVFPYNNVSRAVKVRINYAEMTVQKLWEFGEELGSEYHSAYVGWVQYQEETNSVYICFGGTNRELATGLNRGTPNEPPMDDFPQEMYFDGESLLEKCRFVEVDMDTKEVLFAYDHYDPALRNPFQQPSWKSFKGSLYTSFAYNVPE